MKNFRLKSRFIFTPSGNSSVVERDLAMVDVASSTLVSRSILIKFQNFLAHTPASVHAFVRASNVLCRAQVAQNPTPRTIK